jgi:hypothetical protein
MIPYEFLETKRLFRIAFFVVVLLAFIQANPARASLLLELTPTLISASPGDTVIFQGRITNTTGVPLNATDMFLNFSDVDPTALTDITQLLGTPDFLLANNNVSTIVDLFSVTVVATGQIGPHTAGITLQDVNNNTSDVVTATVQVEASGVPEPSVLLLSASGISLMLIVRVKRGQRMRAARATL